jgi:iron complex outermembrane receptor protein
MQLKGRIYLLSAVSALAMLSINSTASAQEASSTASAQDRGAGHQASELDTVVVTARRRTEDLQATPVAVTVITGETLHGKGFKNLYDLNSYAPGVYLGTGASKSAPLVSIRGMSRGLAGNGQPAVGTYFNDVPGLTGSATMPAYDISGIQVVKGPQGTLFGRNTTAGAILVTSNPPTYEFGASIEGTVGNYDLHQLDLVVNAPIIADKVALRVAGQFIRRDGYTKIQNIPGMEVDRVMIDNYRASLLVEPIEGLRNVTVFDYNANHRALGGSILHEVVPGTWRFVDIFNGTTLYRSPLTPCNGNPVCDLNAAMQRRLLLGPRVAWESVPTPYAKSKTISWTNTTTWDLGFATLKNIFGYRRFHLDGWTDIDTLELIFVNSRTIQHPKQWSDELQLSGEALGGNLNWITGAFWLKSKPAGPIVSLISSVVPTNTPPTAMAGSAPFFTDESKAVYAQINYKFGGISEALDGLSTDLGIRYTKDTTTACTITGLNFFSPPVTASDCPDSLRPEAKFKKVTYTIGLNYQVTPDVLVYGVHRRGYRGGFVNSPIFGGLLTPFQGVRPETVDDYEGGLKSDWRIAGRPLRINIAAFHSTYKDLQASLSTTGIPDPDGNGSPLDNPNGNTFYVNVGDAKIKGVELEAIFSPVDGLEISGNGSWLGKRVSKVALTGVPPAIAAVNPLTPTGLRPVAFSGSPNYTYAIAVDYTLPLSEEHGKITFGVRYSRIGLTRYTAFEQDAYSMWNANFDWTRVMDSNFDVGVFINNIADTATPVGAAVSSAGFGLLTAFYSEPRMIGVRVRYAMGSVR